MNSLVLTSRAKVRHAGNEGHNICCAETLQAVTGRPERDAVVCFGRRLSVFERNEIEASAQSLVSTRALEFSRSNISRVPTTGILEKTFVTCGYLPRRGNGVLV